jgi:pilus assembly protein FimV
MSRGQNPLVLMMALSLPGAANALGLGEIHVDSALNEPLAAEIDIVGASADDLAGLTATIANKETFVRFGADRPAFLSSATFKVSQDAKGRPVLAIRSTDSFTEPLVNLVVDLRWHNGEVIRQYSLLLDPAGFPSAIQ